MNLQKYKSKDTCQKRQNMAIVLAATATLAVGIGSLAWINPSSEPDFAHDLELFEYNP